MKILITGVASPLGRGLLGKLLETMPWSEFWCGIHRAKIDLADPRVHFFPLNLEEEFSLPSEKGAFELVIHLAGLAHSFTEDRYWEVNHQGTMRLAMRLLHAGCRRFVYISSFRATMGAGAYGESKLATERALGELPWEKLLILRPSEIYGAGGTEGIERFLSMAKRYRVVPMLLGNGNIRISPLFFQDFIDWSLRLIAEPFSGTRAVNMRGPENLSGVDLALRISRFYRAVPIPIWWPILILSSWVLKKLGLKVLTPDQLPRLVSQRTESEREEAIPTEKLTIFFPAPSNPGRDSSQ